MSNSLKAARFPQNRCLVGLVALTFCAFLLPISAIATITTVGNVTPAPPAGGGNFAGPFLIGDTNVGTLTLNNGPPLNVTSGNITVGNDNTGTGIGIVSLTGLGSNLTTTAAGSDFIIGNEGTGSVLVSNLAQISIVDDLFIGVVDGSSGTLFVDGLGSFTYVPGSVLLGQSGSGTVQLTNGGRVYADDTVIGQTVTADGRLTVSGHTSLWRQNAMTVGDAGRGTLQILTQGRMESLNVVAGNTPTGLGLLDVIGASSVWEVFGFMNLGVSGNATLRVLDGGRLINSAAARLATAAGSETHVEINGANSLWSIGTTINVGENGFATMSILNGGNVQSDDAIIGDNAGARGEVTVSGENSLWEITGTLDVSQPGTASLAISSGGRVTTTGTALVGTNGEIFLAGGRLSVGAAGGLTNQGLVLGGGRIDGLVTNSSIGEIRVRPSNALTLGNSLVNSGLINVDSGEFEVLTSATNNADIDVRNGVLRFQGGISNSATAQIAILGGEVDIFGTITNAVGGQIVVGGEAHAAFHDTFTNNGSLLVMPGAELLTLENLVFGAGSSLVIELQDVSPNDLNSETTDGYGQVQTTSATILGGNLEVSLAGPFTPALGDSFQVLTAADGRTGFFANADLPTLAGGLGWDVLYNPTSVVLAVVSALDGDYNGDGFVNAADYTLWRNNLGDANEDDLHGNGDGGGVTMSDYNLWKQNYGNSIDASGSAFESSSNVPEPSTLVLLLLAATALAFPRKRG